MFLNNQERVEFIPQDEAFAGAKKEIINLGADNELLAKIDRIQIGQYLSLGKNNMVLTRESSNSYRIAKTENLTK